MALAVRPDYINPLNMVDHNKNALTKLSEPKRAAQSKEEDSTEDLRARKQSLQNQLLLMENSTSTAAASSDIKSQLEQQIKEVSTKLQASQNQPTAVRQPEYDRYIKT